LPTWTDTRRVHVSCYSSNVRLRTMHAALAMVPGFHRAMLLGTRRRYPVSQCNVALTRCNIWMGRKRARVILHDLAKMLGRTFSHNYVHSAYVYVYVYMYVHVCAYMYVCCIASASIDLSLRVRLREKLKLSLLTNLSVLFN